MSINFKYTLNHIILSQIRPVINYTEINFFWIKYTYKLINLIFTLCYSYTKISNMFSVKNIFRS